MIVVRTPLRISFAGGGSDFREYYRRSGGGVLCTAIDKYIHVIVQERFDRKIRIGYSTTELRDHLDDVRHELAREALRRVGVESGIEIATMADVPSTGTGLGSSSSVTVGLLNALYNYAGRPTDRETLAREATEIEIDVLHKPIGKQDQYIAAYGGLRRLAFEPDDSVTVRGVALDDDARHTLSDSLLLFYTGIGRDASSVLKEQRNDIDRNVGKLDDMVRVSTEMESMLSSGQFDEFGRALDYCWNVKKQLASNVSNSAIDELYARAVGAGALGGKITGAGGGGFLLVYCEYGRQASVRKALSDLVELRFALEPDGSKVLFST